MDLVRLAKLMDSCARNLFSVQNEVRASHTRFVGHSQATQDSIDTQRWWSGAEAVILSGVCLGAMWIIKHGLLG